MVPKKPAITPEILTPRLGEFLVQEKLITKEQLEEALLIQKNFRQQNPGVHAPLVGEILVEEGHIEKAVVDQSVTRIIMRLKNALEKSNANLEERVKERTKELEFALNKIKVLNTHKSEFVSNISHELRTPLTHISGYTYLFMDGAFGDLDEEQMSAISAINNATNRLEQLITDLISFTDIDQGNLLLERKLTDIDEIAQFAFNANQSLAKEKQIQLIQSIDKDLPEIIVDPDRVQWVLRHLIENAIKFSKKNGKVLLSIKNNKTSILFSVVDNGIGIPDDKTEEIFEPFLQLDGSSTRNAGGTGIGLSICKEIIEAHNSSIKVKSKVNQGTEFSFKINLSEEN